MERQKDGGSPTPMLKHRKEFEEILANYTVSESAIAVLAETPFVCLSAATASGRNTIIDILVRNTAYYYPIAADTTRPMRYKDGVPVEQEGVQYFFRSEEEVLARLREGEFIEAKIIHNQQVSGKSIREVEKAYRQGKIAITDITVEGFQSIALLKPDTVGIFVLPPSFQEWLRRIKKRSTLTPEEIKNRLESALEEYAAALEDDRFIFVINDDLDEAVHLVDSLSRLNQHRKNVEDEARKLAKRLREEAAEYLAKYPNW